MAQTTAQRQLYREAMRQFENSDFLHALKAFQVLLEESGRPELHYYVGYCQFKVGLYREARDHFLRALEVQPDSWQVNLAIGRTLFHLARYAEARSFLEKVLSVEPENVAALHHLGMIALRRGDWSAAIARFQAVLKLDPHQLASMYNLGQAYLRLGEKGKARRWLSRHRRLAASFDRLESLRKAASFPSSTPLNWIALGNAYIEVGQFGHARESFERALKLDPSLEQIHYALGYTLFQLGQENDAVHHYRLFLTTHPHHFEALYNLGQAQARLGRPEAALRSWRRAREVRPKSPLPVQALLELFLREKRWGEALEASRELLSLTSRSANAHSLRARALAGAGQTSLALKAARQAVRLDPGNRVYHLLLAEILESLGRIDEARRQRQHLPPQP